MFDTEYATSRANLGTTCSDSIYDQYERAISPWLTMLGFVSFALPMVSVTRLEYIRIFSLPFITCSPQLYIIIAAIHNPIGLLLSDIAIQRQAASNI